VLPPERRIQHGAGEWQLMASGEHRMLGHQVPAVADLSALARAHDLHRRADEPPGHRVAVGVTRHQPVVGDDAAANQCCEEVGTAGHRNERCRLAAEALARHLVGRAVDAQVGDLGLPGRELLSSGRFSSFNMKTADPTMFSAASDCDGRGTTTVASLGLGRPQPSGSRSMPEPRTIPLSRACAQF
jgi:hypothetical protein